MKMAKIRETLSTSLKSKKTRRWIIAALIVLALVVFFTYRHFKAKATELPEGIASGNGRIESQEVDVASQEALAVKEVLVEEGDLVRPGQVLVKMDTVTLESELEEARESVASARMELAVAKAAIAK